jgi:glycosyltransferase involved in cell wall biosynthesis
MAVQSAEGVDHFNIFNKSSNRGADRLSHPNGLDEITIMRYAHVYRNRSSGGAEQYLRQLNCAILRRHRLTIVQTHLVTDNGHDEPIECEEVEKGKIIWVPLSVRRAERSFAKLWSNLSYLVQRVNNWHPRQQGLPSVAALVKRLLTTGAGDLRYHFSIFSDRVAQLLLKEDVDLLAFHWVSYDCPVLLSAAREAHIPYVVINHFSNDRLDRRPMKKLIAGALGVGGVSQVSVPSPLRDEFTNLSDGIDLGFFNPTRLPAPIEPAIPVLLLPGRMVEGKGHRDLLTVASILNRQGVNVSIAFAGIVESESLCRELKMQAASTGLNGRVQFLGQLTPEELRNWYNLSTVVVLPSESEGLGRVLLEAQAMMKPVVTYHAWGVSEALVANETGILVRRGDVSALAESVGILVQDDEKRRAMGRRGRDFVARRFNLEDLVNRHETFYLRALGQSTGLRHPCATS